MISSNNPTGRVLRGLLLGACGLGTLQAQTDIYDSGGFEGPLFLLQQPLDGQDPAPPVGNGPWHRDDGTSTALITATNAIDGTKSVRIVRDPGATGNTRWGVVKPTTPAGLDNLVDIRFDMKVVQRPDEFGPLFGVEAYDSQSGTPKLIGSLLIDASTGQLLCQQAGTSKLVPTGHYPDLARHHHYLLSLDFTAGTYSVHADGVKVHTEGFVDATATSFTDAPMVTLSMDPSGGGGTAYLDNYRIENTTSQLPYLTWRGDGAANAWDLGHSDNWFDGIARVAFGQGDDVLFDGSGSASVRIEGDLRPASLKVSSPLNHSFSGPGSIAGATELLKEGSGVLTIGNANGYTGRTTVASGGLDVRNTTGSATGSGPVSVTAGSVLSGDGTIGGPADLAAGAIVSPGAGPGTLTFGDDLTLDGTTLEFELGSASDRMDVAGDLTLGGTLEITADDGFGQGSYTLLNYGGELTEGSLVITRAPGDFDYDIDTTSPGTVTLIVSELPPAPEAPDSLAASPDGTDTVVLNWSDRSANEDSFLIERTTGAGEFVLVGSTGPDATSHTDTGLAAGTTYHYRVRASNRGGDSAYSNTASARTELSPVTAHFEFELTTLDSSGNNNHAVPAGTLLYEQGHVGDNAATFNGTAFAEITRVVEDSFTVMMWVKTTADAGGGSWYNGMGLVDGEMVGGTSDWGCSILNSKFAFGVGAPDTTLLSNRSVNDGGWHHVAATRDSSSGEVRIYIDGTLDTAVGLPTGPRTAPTQLRIGATQSNPPVFFDGAMDDLRFYQGVLTASEVAELAGAPAPPPPPVGDPIVIHPLGDSITWGYTTGSLADSPGGYREPLYRNLLLDGYPAIRFVGANTSNTGPLLDRDGQIHHDGYPQYTITEISNNLDGDHWTGKTRGNNGGYWLTGGGVRPAIDPDIVLLLAGTNDIEAGAEAPVIESRMDAMVGKILSLRPDTTLYLSSIPPYPADAFKTAKAKAYNRLLVERTMPKYLAAGYDIRFVDQYPNFVLVPDAPEGDVINSALYGDTVHPNEAGYQLMGDTWAAALLGAPQPNPSAPGNLEVAGVSEDGITLVWDDLSSNEGVFLIQRTLDGLSFETIGHVGPDVTSFTDTYAGGGRTYGYRIVARNSGGDSGASNYLTVTALGGPSLTTHLKLDESAGTTAFDSTLNGNDGTLVNGPVWTSGKIGNAISLDGADDHLTLPTGIVGSLEDFTITSWVRLDSLDNWARIFDFGTDTTNYMFVTPKSSTKGKMRFALRTPASGSEQGIDGDVAMPVGRWSHVAVTLSGSTATLYLDGEPVGSNDAVTLDPSSLGLTDRNYLGKSQWNDPLLDGALDDFRIHDRALGVDEIRAIVELREHAVPIPSSPTGLVAVAGDGKVDLSWNGVDGAESYSVYRVTGGNHVLIAAGLEGSGYTDTGLVNGTTYTYAVTASNAAGESTAAANVEVIPVPNVVYEGRAVVATVGVLGTPVTLGDTGNLPNQGGSREAGMVALDGIPGLGGNVGHAFTSGQAGETRSEAALADLVLEVAGTTIEADFLMARAWATGQPDGTTLRSADSEIYGLNVAGFLINTTGEPNQTFDLPIGQLIVNERIATGTTVTVNALRLIPATGDDIIISSATAGFESNELPPLAGDDRISGGGWIPGTTRKRNFGFSAGYDDGALVGHLTYHDKDTGMKVIGTSVGSYGTGATPGSRIFSGTAEIDGTGGHAFTIEAVDNGEPGTADTFRIELSNGYVAEGQLGGGNIQLHSPG